MLLVIISTIFDKIRRGNILISSMTIKLLSLAWVNESKYTFMHWMFRKISWGKCKLWHLSFIREFYHGEVILSDQPQFFFLLSKQKPQISSQVFFFLILSTIKGELRLRWKSKEHQQIWALLSFWIAFLVLSSFKWFSMAGTFFLISHS